MIRRVIRRISSFNNIDPCSSAVLVIILFSLSQLDANVEVMTAYNIYIRIYTSGLFLIFFHLHCSRRCCCVVSAFLHSISSRGGRQSIFTRCRRVFCPALCGCSCARSSSRPRCIIGIYTGLEGLFPFFSR